MGVRSSAFLIARRMRPVGHLPSRLDFGQDCFGHRRGVQWSPIEGEAQGPSLAHKCHRFSGYAVSQRQTSRMNTFSYWAWRGLSRC